MMTRKPLLRPLRSWWKEEALGRGSWQRLLRIRALLLLGLRLLHRASASGI
ncbi:MAG: hypothetical protein RLZZ106_1399, partial [Cyanobacteriota bacterium]